MNRTCPSCGTDITADDALHCHRCGTKLDATEASWPGHDAADDSAPPSSDWRTAAQDAGVGYNEPAPSRPAGRPAPSGARGDSTTWAMAAHGSALLAALPSIGIFVFVGPLIVWLIKRDEDPFVERHARNALNFNLLMTILIVVGFVGAFLTLGLGLIILVPLAFILGLVWLVTTIIGIVRAANGEEYDYPFNVSFIR